MQPRDLVQNVWNAEAKLAEGMLSGGRNVVSPAFQEWSDSFEKRMQEVRKEYEETRTTWDRVAELDCKSWRSSFTKMFRAVKSKVITDDFKNFVESMDDSLRKRWQEGTATLKKWVDEKDSRLIQEFKTRWTHKHGGIEKGLKTYK